MSDQQNEDSEANKSNAPNQSISGARSKGIYATHSHKPILLKKSVFEDIDQRRHLILDLDDVLIHEVGQFGRYQLYCLLLLSLPIITSAFRSEFVFGAASLPHRCRIPECGEKGKLEKFNPDWIENAIPIDKTHDRISSCTRYKGLGQNGTPDNCPASLFGSSIITCHQFVYENDDTVYYEFDLACQEKYRTLAGTLNSVGTLLVLPMLGYISDRFGRRIAILLSMFFFALFGFIRAFSRSFVMYIVLQLLQTTFGGGTYSCAYILATEVMGPKYRVVAGATISSIFALGQIILGGVAWAVQYWRNIILVLYAPCFLLIGQYWLLPESVRWLLSKEKYDKARRMLEKMAKCNKKQMSEKSINALLNSPEIHNVKHSKWNIIKAICRSKVLRKRITITPFWWITTTLVYYGLSINATTMSKSKYLNYMLTCAIEIPALISSVFALNKIGRKKTLCIGFMFSAAANFAFVIVPHGFTITRLVLYLSSKFGITMVFMCVYLYTTELYPTQYRHSLLAFSSMVGRLGSIIAPMTPILNEYLEGLPNIVFGCCAIVSGILVMGQPETLGLRMPDTLAEAENLGYKGSQSTVSLRYN